MEGLKIIFLIFGIPNWLFTSYTFNEVKSQEVTYTFFLEDYGSQKDEPPVDLNKWDSYIELITMNEEAKAWLKRVYRCESGGDQYAKNPISPASGLMQFFPSTFRAYGGKDIWDGEEQLRVALIMYEKGQQHQWVCK